MSDTSIGISATQLIALLLSQGYEQVGDRYVYQHRMTVNGETGIMRFNITPIGDVRFNQGDVTVTYRQVGTEEKFEVIGLAQLAQLRIAPMGKLIGVRSVPRKQKYDRKKKRKALLEGRTYKRGDK